jgi:hypothetical protein
MRAPALDWFRTRYSLLGPGLSPRCSAVEYAEIGGFLIVDIGEVCLAAWVSMAASRYLWRPLPRAMWRRVP